MKKIYRVTTTLCLEVEVNNQNEIVDAMDTEMDESWSEDDFLDNTKVICLTDDRILSRNEVQSIFFEKLN